MMEVSFSALLTECDSILAASPSTANVDRFCQLVRDPTLYSYAFLNLRNPEWVKPLRNRGFFTSPPPPIFDKDTSTFTFPIWPEVQYLIRVAAVAPEDVLEVIVNIPLTDNTAVHNDLARAALEMPPGLAAKWAVLETDWLNRQDHHINGLQAFAVGKLISHLAGAMKEIALSFAEALLRVLPDPRASEKSREGSSRLPLEPYTLIGFFDYEIILRENIPHLVVAARAETLTLLCNLLNNAITLSRDHDSSESTEDYSYIWRPSLEFGQDHGLKDLLVTSVRRALDTIPDDINEISSAVTILNQRRWRIFQRLFLYLIDKHAVQTRPLIEQSLINENLYGEDAVKPEWSKLAATHFSELSREKQNVYLSWVDKGPGISFEQYRDFHRQWVNKEISERDYDAYVRQWKRDQLAVVSHALPEDLKGKYEALVSEFGPFTPADPSPFLAADLEGIATSPKTVDELKQMSVDELIRYLSTIPSVISETRYSKFALASNLTTAVSSAPHVFAGAAQRFWGLDSTYLSSLITGLRQAVEAGAIIEWGPVLALCKQILSNAVNQTQDSTLKRPILSLLFIGFKTGAAEIPTEFRSLVWEILKPLTNDPEPTAEYEAKYGGSNMDAATMSLNTVRGEAIHRSIEYGLWVRRALEKNADALVIKEKGFDELPELREMLDQHLNIEREPSLSIRAVYGQWFPWLVFLDKKWSSDRVHLIFPKENTLSQYHAAAWYTYLVFCQPYDEVFDVLREEYMTGISRLGLSREVKPPFGNPEQSLASHIVALYWRGKIDLGESGLIQKFFLHATNQLAGFAMAFIGRALKNTKTDVAVTVLERLRNLWEVRLQNALAKPDEHSAELSAFGWWFTSGKFEIDWSLEQLQKALGLVGEIDDDHEVIEELAKLSSVDPIGPITCLNLLMKRPKQPWRIFAYQGDARTIISSAINSNDSAARLLAEDTVQRLMAQGHLMFRELLPPTVI